MSYDVLIVLMGFSCFAIWFVAQAMLFRFLKPEHLFKAVIESYVAGLLLCLVVGGLVFRFAPLGDALLYMFLCVAIYALAGLFYVTCFLGPYETSIRMRLIRELAKARDGMPLADLLAQYNTAIILDQRLLRLLGPGDLVRRDGKFYSSKKGHVLFFLDAVARKLHAFIHAR
jgi:hypothetical protein